MFPVSERLSGDFRTQYLVYFERAEFHVSSTSSPMLATIVMCTVGGGGCISGSCPR